MLGTVKLAPVRTPLAFVVPAMVTAVPLNVAVSEPELAANPLPLTVTEVPTEPFCGDSKVIFGVTVKFPAEAIWVWTVTTTACAPARLPGAVAGIVNVGGVVVGIPPVAVVVVVPESVTPDPAYVAVIV